MSSSRRQRLSPKAVIQPGRKPRLPEPDRARFGVKRPRLGVKIGPNGVKPLIWREKTCVQRELSSNRHEMLTLPCEKKGIWRENEEAKAVKRENFGIRRETICLQQETSLLWRETPGRMKTSAGCTRLFLLNLAT